MHDERFIALIQSTSRAKRATASLYGAWRERAPGLPSRLTVARIAEEEAAHSAALDHLIEPASSASSELESVPAVGCGLADDTWPSALMAAFALDQAATAALIALSRAPDVRLAHTADTVVADERLHQNFAIGAFRAIADQDPALG